MKIVVMGGSGLIGTRLIPLLRQRQHETLAASSRLGVNAITGEGLPQAMAGASVVIDVMNAPAWEDAAVLEFFQTSTRNLLNAEKAAGVGHHIVLSVVGTDRLQDSGYFRAKLAQEQLVQAAGIPYTIVRATQFFEFLGAIADSRTEGDTVRQPPSRMQPIAADDVAALLAEIAEEAPTNGIVDIAGPEVLGIDEAVRQTLTARADPRTVLSDPTAPYFQIQLGTRTLSPEGPARLGPTTLAEWLQAEQSKNP